MLDKEWSSDNIEFRLTSIEQQGYVCEEGGILKTIANFEPLETHVWAIVRWIFPDCQLLEKRTVPTAALLAYDPMCPTVVQMGRKAARVALVHRLHRPESLFLPEYSLRKFLPLTVLWSRGRVVLVALVALVAQ